MSSLLSTINASGSIKLGDKDAADVLLLQVALTQAGYRVATDGLFGPRTQQSVMQFQKQHGLVADGIVGPITAAVLDAPHAALVETAKPLIAPPSGNKYKWPHDDTSSLLSFYGKPWENSGLLKSVTVPFHMTYRDNNGVTSTVKTVRVHTKCVNAITEAFNQITRLAEVDGEILKHVTHLSGTYNYRPVRGSSRLSTHAFGASIDFHAEALPLGKAVPATEMPIEIVQAFKSVGAFWGGDYTGRKDPMHFQFAHE